MENSGEDIKFGEVGLCVDRVGPGLIVGKAYRALLELESLRSHIGVEKRLRESCSSCEAHDERHKKVKSRRENDAGR